MSVRLAVRAVIVEAGRVLLVNAYPGEASDLWCLPGGGAEAGANLEENLRREVREEVGLEIAPGRLLAVSEFHDPTSGFHQVDLIYRAARTSTAAAILADPGAVVNRLLWADAETLERLRYKPGCLGRLAFGPEGPVIYDPLEVLVR